MKLEEAASILGVSLDEITIDTLKQTYKKLNSLWDPEKVDICYNIKSTIIFWNFESIFECIQNKEEFAIQKHQLISEAYKKLNSIMEGNDAFQGDDSHEIAAFMRMFMNMVGISESDTISSG